MNAGLELWIPCFAVAHLLAGLWLLHAFLPPGQLRFLRHWLLRKGPFHHPQPHLGQAFSLQAASPHHTVLHPAGQQQSTALGISWFSLSCSYPAAEGKQAYVLQDALGHIRPGQLGVVLGPSGCGKSTLLEILAGRKAVGKLSGHVALTAGGFGAAHQSEHKSQHVTATWRGIPAHRAAVLKCSSFVPQDDALPACLTAQEVLEFCAAMELPSAAAHTAQQHSGQSRKSVFGGARAMRKQAVDDALAAMGLHAQRFTLVGGSLPGGLQIKGLSGGERKRLNVACGCLPGPKLLLLDEPTTGLDSAAALKVVSRLHAMCASGHHTVIASMHQPRAAMWDQLVDMAVVQSVGRTLYAGPPAAMVGWLSGTLGCAYSPSRHGSAPDWAVDLVNVGFKKPKRFYSSFTLETPQDLQHAAARFADHYIKHCGRISCSGRRVSVDGTQAGIHAPAAAPAGAEQLAREGSTSSREAPSVGGEGKQASPVQHAGLSSTDDMQQLSAPSRHQQPHEGPAAATGTCTAAGNPDAVAAVLPPFLHPNTTMCAGKGVPHAPPFNLAHAPPHIHVNLTSPPATAAATEHTGQHALPAPDDEAGSFYDASSRRASTSDLSAHSSRSASGEPFTTDGATHRSCVSHTHSHAHSPGASATHQAPPPGTAADGWHGYSAHGGISRPQEETQRGGQLAGWAGTQIEKAAGGGDWG